MKAILIVVAVVVIAASIFADYKWRCWVASRRAEHRPANNGERRS